MAREPRGLTGSYLRGRVQELTRAETRAAAVPLSAWACKRIRLDGTPFSFDGHAYQRAIYDDTAAHVVLSKAAQIGGTTWAILRSLHACLQGLHVIYFFPTRSDVLEFSKSRVGPLLAENEFLRALMKDTDTAGLKQIGSANLYFRGMQSSVGMKSVPADMIVFDELDEATPEAKAMARERLAHSSYKRILELSNPSLPAFGIDEAYQQSDQRHWTLKCPACGAWTALDKAFPLTLGQEVRILREREDGRVERVCPECEAPLDLAAGEWVADFPGRRIHGYRISQLFSAQVDPAEILTEYRTTRFPDRFYNLKIGIPWADLDRRLDAASVLACCGSDPMQERSTGTCFLGIDTGKDLHAVVLEEHPRDERFSLIAVEVVHDFSALDDLMARYAVDTCVIDGLPETHATRDFARRHAGKVFLNFFNEHQRGLPKWDPAASTVQVNRTEALDASRAAIRQHKVTLPRRDPRVELFAQHMAANAKKLDEDPDTGAKKYRYIRTGADHLSLAFTYAWLATSRANSYRTFMRFLRESADPASDPS